MTYKEGYKGQTEKKTRKLEKSPGKKNNASLQDLRKAQSAWNPAHKPREEEKYHKNLDYALPPVLK